MNEKGKLTGYHLKLIAVVTMFIDHFAATVVERMLQAPVGTYPFVDQNADAWLAVYGIMRVIGRMAFPLYCFLLVEGFTHTRSLLKYHRNLLVFALISEVPFDLAFNHSWQELSYNNVFWTLLFGLLAITSIHWLHEKLRITTETRILRYFLVAVRGIALMTIALFFMGVAEYVFCTDYGAAGVAAILVMYLLRRHPMWGMGAMVFLLGLLAGSIEFAAAIMLIAVYNYNGQRGKDGTVRKYFFYWFYPVHLLLLVGLCVVMGLPVVR